MCFFISPVFQKGVFMRKETDLHKCIQYAKDVYFGTDRLILGDLADVEVMLWQSVESVLTSFVPGKGRTDRKPAAMLT